VGELAVCRYTFLDMASVSITHIDTKFSQIYIVYCHSGLKVQRLKESYWELEDLKTFTCIMHYWVIEKLVFNNFGKCCKKQSYNILVY
jgi:hypothetical protein